MQTLGLNDEDANEIPKKFWGEAVSGAADNDAKAV